jgi:hypothetical protein
MARSFIYDNIGLTESTLTDGTVSGTTYDPTVSTVTNEERAIDMSISTALTGFSGADDDDLPAGGDDGTDDGLRFDVGTANASTNANAIAVYFTSAHGHDMKVYSGSSATDGTVMGTALANKTDNWVVGWNVITFSATAGQYWFIHATTGLFDDITEVIIGNKYDFDVNPELNAKTGEEFGTDIMTSYGGNEYANKRHAPKTTWDWNWSHILSTQKTALESLNASVQDWKKFIYYDDSDSTTTPPSTYHYVRMTKPVTFTEVAPNVYSANMSLREQLS